MWDPGNLRGVCRETHKHNHDQSEWKVDVEYPAHRNKEQGDPIGGKYAQRQNSKRGRFVHTKDCDKAQGPEYHYRLGHIGSRKGHRGKEKRQGRREIASGVS